MSESKKQKSKNLFSFLASQHLERSILLKESGSPLLTRIVIIITMISVAGFLIWSIFMEIDEVVRAEGIVTPDEKVLPLQHLEGGRVNTIKVREGDIITKDQILIQLDTLEIKAQLEEVSLQEKISKERRLRIEKFLESSKEVKLNDIKPHERDIYSNQINLLEQNLISLKAKQNVSLHQISQLEEEINENHLLLENTLHQIKILSVEEKRHKETGMSSANLLILEKEALQEEMDIREELVDQGLNSNIKFLALQRQAFQIDKDIFEAQMSYQEKLYLYEKQIEDLKNQQLTLPHSIAAKKKKISQLKEQLVEDESQLKVKALEEIDKLWEAEALAKERRKALQDRLDHALIKSPIDGIVHELIKGGPGTIIAPGQLLMYIVPKDSPLSAQVKINNQDIGHLVRGQSVRLKISTFDHSKYGSLPGKLIDLSPTTSEDETGESKYTGKILITNLKPSEKRNALPLKPGMSLEADIITGKKSVMEYLLKPIYSSAKEALQER